MPVVDIATLKSYFQTGDTPTEAQFIDLMDTLFSMVQNTGDQTSIILRDPAAGGHKWRIEIDGTGELVKTDLGL